MARTTEQLTISQASQQLLQTIRTAVAPKDEENDEQMSAKITAKLQSGKRLSKKELEWLARNNPWLYQQALRIEQTRKSVEEQCRHARSKKEIQDIQWSTLRAVSDQDPVRDYMIAAIQDTIQRVQSSEDYQKLPADDSEKTGRKKHLYGKLSAADDSADRTANRSAPDTDQRTLRKHLTDMRRIESAAASSGQIAAITDAAQTI